MNIIYFTFTKSKTLKGEKTLASFINWNTDTYPNYVPFQQYKGTSLTTAVVSLSKKNLLLFCFAFANCNCWSLIYSEEFQDFFLLTEYLNSFLNTDFQNFKLNTLMQQRQLVFLFAREGTSCVDA